MLSRTLTPVIWLIALGGLAAWTLLAWGTGTLIDGSGDWLGHLALQWLENARKEALASAAVAWMETLGEVVVWTTWALGSLGLVIAAAFATLLLRRTANTELA